MGTQKNPKHMFRLLSKKKIKILSPKILQTGPMTNYGPKHEKLVLIISETREGSNKAAHLNSFADPHCLLTLSLEVAEGSDPKLDR